LGDTTSGPLRTALSILADCAEIVNATGLASAIYGGDPSLRLKNGSVQDDARLLLVQRAASRAK
jgi:hypothetical protein